VVEAAGNLGAVRRARVVDGARVRSAAVLAARIAAGRAAGALSTALTVRSGLGTGPWDTLLTAGEAASGVAYAALSATVSLGFALLARGHGARLHPMMLVYAATGGVLVQTAIPRVPAARTPAEAWGYTAAAVALGAVSAALVLGVQPARTAYEGALAGLAGRRRWSAGRSRLALDLPALATGWALGGRVGPGTVIASFCTGPLVQVLLRARPPRLPTRAALARPAAAAAELAARLTPFEPMRAVA
jgi:uncharacterized membrane protein YczE